MNDQPASPLPADFLDLVDKRLDGVITAGEQAALERHLTDTPGAMAHYLTLASAEALLADEFPDAPRATGIPARRNNLVRPGRSVWTRRIPLALGSAAALAVIALIGSGVTHRESATPAEVPARLMRSLGVTWKQGETRPGKRLTQDTGEIAGGFVELRFDSGVKLLVEGPASYRITGRNSCRLAYGKAVADVPDGAQGFTLESARERIIDHGTRFAVDVAGDGGETTVGVLSGEVELRHAGNEVRLYTDYALRRTGDTLASVPFDRSNFATEIPVREFLWNMAGAKPGEVRALYFDVSRLVHGPGEYRAVFKWLEGLDMLNIRSVELIRDGVSVARNDGPFATGAIGSTQNNAPVLHVAPGDYAKGRWELVARASCQFTDEKIRKTPPESAGIVTLEDGPAVNATEKEFLGRWNFSHNGVDRVREFLPGGNFRAWKNGKPDPRGDDTHYTVKDGVLTLFQRGVPPETHMLRDDGTLVFLNQPYRNAHREPVDGK